jgi:hypothetical protein
MIKKYSFLVALIGFIISIASPTCACGYYLLDSFFFSTTGLILSWLALLMYKKIGLVKRIIIGFTCVITTLILFKNIADILWFGHEPLLM